VRRWPTRLRFAPARQSQAKNALVRGGRTNHHYSAVVRLAGGAIVQLDEIRQILAVLVIWVRGSLLTEGA
jgi:hypothetical protein